MDLSKLSTADLVALQRGDLGKVSTPALTYLQTGRFGSGQSLDVLADGSTAPTGSPDAIAAQSPVSDSAAENFWAGVGKGATDLGRGAGQWVGAVSRQDVADSRQRDQPLMDTTAGKVGNISGKIATAIPAAMIPGANTAVGAGLIGAAQGALEPSTSDAETATNIGLGGLTGAAGQVVGNKIVGAVTNRLAARQATSQAEQLANQGRDAVLQEGRAAGYVVPPTAVNPSMMNTAAESLAGKAAVRQSAQVINQKVTNNLVRQDFGLPEGSPITREVLKNVRTQAGGAYNQVKNALGDSFSSDKTYLTDLGKVLEGTQALEATYPGIGSQADKQIEDLVKSVAVDAHSGESAVNLSKLLRNRSSANYRAASMAGGDPEKLALARAQNQTADALEELIGRQLDKNGQGYLSKSWDNARTTIAKSYQAQAALDGTDVSAMKLAAQLRKDKPVSGGMGIAARFADQFDEVAKVPQSGAGVSKLGASSVVLGLASGHPIIGTVYPIASAVSKAGMLSRMGQNALARPNYAPSITGTASLNALRAGSSRAGQIAASVAPALP